ncbi:hypothetical protein AAV94_06620 [Lampropedia cohaerens]|uniref:DUF4282 domain-containing protein n=1 Tax=Lampropedia cohaerens TaxID=1610491 RepID=A0A0U1Q047_9BURK|nr:DUF4282 domain-containing protein [Lampropedia cohaerens]KKW68139.1 hypothetical protein AAV94_06620 [Lampropedia cohaerens]
MRKYLYFDTMVAPRVITLLYWLQLGLYALGALAYVMAAFMLPGGFFMTLLRLLIGALLFALACLFARVSAEVLLVIFKIHDNLKTIAERGDRL